MSYNLRALVYLLRQGLEKVKLRKIAVVPIYLHTMSDAATDLSPQLASIVRMRSEAVSLP